jgi:hypothetical protein
MGMTWNRLTYEGLTDNWIDTLSITNVIANDNIIAFPTAKAGIEVELAMAA